MTEMSTWPLWVALILIGFTLGRVRRALSERKRMLRRELPVVHSLFHDSHPRIVGDPEPHKISWEAMRNRKVGR